MMETNHLTRTFESLIRCCSLNLLLKNSSETTRLSAGRPSGAKQCSSRTQSLSLAAEYKMRFCFAHDKNTRRNSFAKAEVQVFDSQNVVICCEESEHDPVYSASLEERKRSEFVRHLSLLSEINQQLKQQFRRIAMKRSRHVNVIQMFLAVP